MNRISAIAARLPPGRALYVGFRSYTLPGGLSRCHARLLANARNFSQPRSRHAEVRLLLVLRHEASVCGGAPDEPAAGRDQRLRVIDKLLEFPGGHLALLLLVVGRHVKHGAMANQLYLWLIVLSI
jgi:hypothetical protein